MDKSVHADRTFTWHDSCKHGRAAYYAFGDDSNFDKMREILSYCFDMKDFVEMPHNQDGLLLLRRRRRQLARTL